MSSLSRMKLPIDRVLPYLTPHKNIETTRAMPSHHSHAYEKVVNDKLPKKVNTKVHSNTLYNLIVSINLSEKISWKAVYTEASACKKLIATKYRENTLSIWLVCVDSK